MKKYRHPASINSSLFVFFLVFTALISYAITVAFSEYGRLQASIVVATYSLAVWLIWYWIMQFQDEDRLMLYIVLAIILVPFASGIILNLLFGTLQTKNVPLLNGFGFFGWNASIVEAKPSVLINYAFLTFATANILSIPAEHLYIRIVRFLPKSLRKWLQKVDSAIDQRSEKLSDGLLTSVNRGILLGLGLLLIQSVVLYFLLSI